MRVHAERALDAVRETLGAGAEAPTSDGPLPDLLEEIPRRVETALEQEVGTPLRRVINATGVFVHTNLGRSPLPPPVSQALPGLLDAYCDLELDLDSGRRADRNRKVEGLLRVLTGAPAAVVVNNNAAALLLALAAIAHGRQVIVSRGELVEIGGSFRIPEVLEAAGVTMCEVGTTNRTRLGDYDAAIGSQTALLLKVFPSNYRLSGFVAEVGVEALVDLSRRREVPLMVDEGSGLLRPHPAPQLQGHASLRQLISAGCALACGSGDKLLGGPQAGLLVGEASLVAACRRHPLYRALRADRTCLAALALVLRRHMAGEEMPLDRMWPPAEDHERRVRRVAAALGGSVGLVDGYLGGGSAPEAGLPGQAVLLPEDDELLGRLRLGSPAVVAYQKQGHLVLDLRTVAPPDDAELIAAVRRARGEEHER